MPEKNVVYVVSQQFKRGGWLVQKKSVTVENLRAFARLDQAKSFVESREGELRISWRERHSHGSCWEANIGGYLIDEVPYEPEE